ncbi:hypothetical protein SAMN05428967_3869 [Phyllobacterium sp. YR620]|uniref:type II toxin-antitoxin system VapC family toxin n=1 Tax=Phyllobacterium sp. YR620 TaxID=1881066 RepID=UPI000880AE2C|nr:type II toxin-antitoxin system VapC family toxin [Phyllobacterium sp. YR620]SDP85414.1 hypothetical protein SAMN05428967_3869 [Phyllobacterium sp. YR620]
MFLIDTNVISALSPMKKDRRQELETWLDHASPYLFLSVITAAEVTNGILKAKRAGAKQKATALAAWWEAIEHLYANRLLAFDLAAAHVAGTILDYARAHAPGFEDIAIAATAKLHGLTVLTANERHFAPLGVVVINPFKMLPALPNH